MPILSPSLRAPAAPPQHCATPLKALIVDDSVVMRQFITRMINSAEGMEVVGYARDGQDAIVKAELYRPDVITMDVEMPRMDGLAALKQIKQRLPRTRVIMCSSLTREGAAATVEALISGADSYVCKPGNGHTMEKGSPYDSLRADLLGKLGELFGPRVTGRDVPAAVLNKPSPSTAPSLPGTGAARPFSRVLPRQAPRILCIGVSTGGPAALAELIPTFPESFPLPIVVVQHMPPQFTATLADRLNRLSSLTVSEAREGMVIEPGHVYLAPGDFHMRLRNTAAGVAVTLDQGERECFCRPAVDALFRSIVPIYGGAVIATVLTGMGSDGLEGVRLLKSQGASVLVQDRESSVVWGMPKAVADANLADAVLPLREIYPSIARLV